MIWVCSISGNTLYVCPNGRGFDNSFAVFHVGGAKVSGMVTAYAMNRHSAEIEAIETALGPNLSNVVLTSNPAYQATTTNVTEGSNLYFTAARAVAAMNGLYQSPITGAPSTWPSFAAAATSGNYGDLNNLPTIPVAASGTPSMDGTAAAGSATSWARGDHVHPTDTSRQATIGGAPTTWPSFATVATSGSYSDLSNQPTIPATTSQISESTNLYFTAARAVSALAGLYQTPITGAPGIWPTSVIVPGITQGTCSSATPGLLNYSGHTAGVKDTVAICAADATGTWAWRPIY